MLQANNQDETDETAREGGRFEAEVNKEVEGNCKKRIGESGSPRKIRKRVKPLWLKDFVMSGIYHCDQADVYKKFTNEEGKFNKALANDAKGTLSLYEAGHLRVHGEQILEEALTFTATHLSSSSLRLTTTKLSPPLATQIKHAIKQPI
nr:sesquiterpene synthase 14-like [Ziziphus jujuba var. spinosa]